MQYQSQSKLKKNKCYIMKQSQKQKKKKPFQQASHKNGDTADYSSFPQTPKNTYKRHVGPQQFHYGGQTESLTKTLVQAVENQKQILRNIKTISAEILKNKKTDRNIPEPSSPPARVQQHFFPIRQFSSASRQLPRSLYGIEQSQSSQSDEETMYNQYYLMNTTKSKAQNCEMYQQDQYLKPKIIHPRNRIQGNQIKKQKKVKADQRKKNKSSKIKKQKSLTKYLSTKNFGSAEKSTSKLVQHSPVFRNSHVCIKRK